MKNIVLIGSTGSIGTQTLDIVRAHRDELTITALAAGRNVEKMEEQIREFSPLMACLYDESAAADLKERVRDLPVRIVCGMDGLLEEARASHHPSGERGRRTAPPGGFRTQRDFSVYERGAEAAREENSAHLFRRHVPRKKAGRAG